MRFYMAAFSSSIGSHTVLKKLPNTETQQVHVGWYLLADGTKIND
jgi:hypothetical protein